MQFTQEVCYIHKSGYTFFGESVVPYTCRPIVCCMSSGLRVWSNGT